MVEYLTEEEREELKRLGATDQQIDEELASLQNELQGGTIRDAPEPKIQDNLLKFTRDILNLEDEEHGKISRSGNVRDEELGKLQLTTRSYLDISGYADSEGLDDVASYLRGKSNIIFNSSLSRRGFFVKLPFSRTSISQALGTPRRTIKKTLFGGSKETIEGESDT